MADECVYNGKKYAHGATSCQDGHEFRCNNGAWEPLGTDCSEAGPPPATSDDTEAAQKK